MAEIVINYAIGCYNFLRVLINNSEPDSDTRIVDGFVVSVWTMNAECWMGAFCMDKYIHTYIYTVLYVYSL